MDVAFVSHTAGLGGAERSLLETVQVLRARGVTCRVLLPRRGSLEQALHRAGVTSRIVPYKGWRGLEGAPAWRRLARTVWNVGLVAPLALILRRWRSDLVYTNTIAVAAGAFAAAAAGRPHVWHLRELAGEHNRLRFDWGEASVLRVLDRYSVLCLANSRCVAAKYGPALAPGKMEVVYQGVMVDDDGAPPALPPRGGPAVAVVGSLGEGKRQEEAIAAVGLLAGRGRLADLWIVGTGDPVYEARLRRMAAAPELRDRVHFLGPRHPAFPILRAADVVVVCSRAEGFGRVTVEAMLAGRPVVGARSGGTAELITHGVNGWLYEPGDVEALAERLEGLIDRPDEARALAARAQDWARVRFDAERYGDEMLALLRRAAGARR